MRKRLWTIAVILCICTCVYVCVYVYVCEYYDVHHIAMNGEWEQSRQALDSLCIKSTKVCG